MSSAKHARLFTFKNTVGGVTADVFTALTSQPKPRRSVPEPRLAFLLSRFWAHHHKAFCLPESHDSVSATHAGGKMVAVSRLNAGQVISTYSQGAQSNSADTRIASRYYMQPSSF